MMSFGSRLDCSMKQQARRKHKMTGEGPSEWPTLTLPPDRGPSVEAYFLVHVRPLHMSTIPFVLLYVYKCKDRSTCSHRRSQDFPNGGHTVSK